VAEKTIRPPRVPLKSKCQKSLRKAAFTLYLNHYDKDYLKKGMRIRVKTYGIWSDGAGYERIDILPVEGADPTDAPAGDLAAGALLTPEWIRPGDDLGAPQVIATNTIRSALKDISVEIILTAQTNYPSPAPSAERSSDDRRPILMNRGLVSFEGPGTARVRLDGPSKVPVDMPPGVYYLGVVMDAGNKVAETDETNNVDFRKILIDPEAPNDLTVSISECPDSVRPGEMLGDRIQVKATSTMERGLEEIVVCVFLTAQPKFLSPAPCAGYSSIWPATPSRSRFGAWRPTAVRLHRELERVSFDGPETIDVRLNGPNTIPEGTPPGVYYLGVAIDAGNKVFELDELNNVVFRKVTVVAPQP